MAIVHIEKATRHYQDGEQVVEALRGLDLTIEQGEFTAIMGPSGSGKTTLLNLIGGMDTPTSGRVTVSGKEVSSMSKTQRSDLRRDHIGFIFQSYNLIPVLTAQENTEFVLLLQGKSEEERGARAKEILAAVGLAGMEGRRPAELSGGQQQRVAVARAIATKPTIIIRRKPTYPRSAQRAGLQGTTTLTITIGTTGRVTSVRIAKSSGHTALDNAAVSAARTWKFKPAKNGLGQAVPYSMSAPVPFKLQ